jgi:hypothetical protein
VKEKEFHGMTGTPIYHVWNGMRARCNNPNNSAYRNYGGRGITICSEWNDSLLSFLKDMGNRPSDEHELDRIDNDGPYCRENCRWVLPAENARNKRDNRLFDVDGVTKCLQDWAEEYKIPTPTLWHRVTEMELSMKEALAYTNSKLLTVKGVTKTQNQWCEELGLNPSTVCGRIKRGWSHERALGVA